MVTASHAAAAVAGIDDRLPTHVGEQFSERLRLDEAGIRGFASSVNDFNPLHHDRALARAAGYPGIIASGTQVGSHMMALTATHFAQPLADGTPRNGRGLGFDIRFRAVVLADEDIVMRWAVTGIERKDTLRGWIVTVEGEASSPRGALIVATGTLLLWLGERT